MRYTCNYFRIVNKLGEYHGFDRLNRTLEMLKWEQGNYSHDNSCGQKLFVFYKINFTTGIPIKQNYKSVWKA